MCCPANVIKYLYVWNRYPVMYIMVHSSSGESDLNFRKSIKEFISVLVDCGACLNRPHNISAESGAWPRWCAGKTQKSCR